MAGRGSGAGSRSKRAGGPANEWPSSPGLASLPDPARAAMKLATGIVLGLAFALIAAVALTPSLSKGTRWFLLMLALVACVLTAVD
jgi:uncharacterized membrane protein YccC